MTSRLHNIILILSVGLNVFLLAISASLFYHRPNATSATSVQRASLRSASLALADPYRAPFVMLLRREGEAIQGDNRLSRSIREQAWASLESQTFDPGKTKSELVRARMLNLTSRGKVEDAVVDFAASLPVTQRSALGQAMIQSIKRQRSGQVQARANTLPNTRPPSDLIPPLDRTYKQ